MQYRLGDICTITKGATGIMKAIPGAYTMIALGETDKTHNEYQFDTKAVIIPLVSSTGHGHASMKRVKYYEGKFALGNILCAVIPKDENFVLAKYLHIYLHWNREELLVSQMKGMANVSLPMNRIADVMVTIPSIEKQREIVSLEKELAIREIEILRLYEKQLTQIENLNQAILQEAVQGKLVQQNSKDEPASELLKRIKAEKAKSGKKEKPLSTIKPKEIPFEIPERWVWCRLSEICSKIGSGSTPKGGNYSEDGFPFFRSQNIHNEGLIYDDIKFISDGVQNQMKGTIVLPNDILLNITGGSMGRCALVSNNFIEGNVSQHVCIIRPMQLNNEYLHKVVLSPYFQKFIFSSTTGAGREGLPKYNLEQFVIPIPPLCEQKRIVAEIEKQFAKTKQLKEHILANQQATEDLLKALLHQAFEAKETVNEEAKAKVVDFIPKICNEPEKAMLAGHIINMTNNEDFGRVKFQKLLHLTEYFCKIDMGSNYVQKVAGPHDDNLIKNIESTLKKLRFYEIRQQGFHSKVNYTALVSASELDSLFKERFKDEESKIDAFLNKFKKSTWEQCEIVSTLYAVWNNRIIKQQSITDDLLKQDFLNWDKNKAKYKDRLDNALTWMRDKGITPDGWGKYIGKPQLSKK